MTAGNSSWGKGFHDGFDKGQQQGTWQHRAEGLAVAVVIGGSVWAAFRKFQGRRTAAAPIRATAPPESEVPEGVLGEESHALSPQARALLQHIGQAPAPLAMSDHFVVLNPRPPEFGEDHPEHPAWTERELALHAASAEIAAAGLVSVVHAADGSHPNLVELTPTGLTALLRP